MTIKFLLMVNKQGQTRLAQYYETLTIAEKSSLEGEIIRKCLARAEAQCSFLEYRTYKCIYRRYASLFFIVGVDSDEVRHTKSRQHAESHVALHCANMQLVALSPPRLHVR